MLTIVAVYFYDLKGCGVIFEFTNIYIHVCIENRRAQTSEGFPTIFLLIEMLNKDYCYPVIS